MDKTPDQIISERYHEIEASRTENLTAAIEKFRKKYKSAITVIDACSRGPHQLDRISGLCKDTCSTCAAIKFIKGFDE